MEKRKKEDCLFGWMVLICVLTAVLAGVLPTIEVRAAILGPSNVVTQGTVIIKSYSCNVAALRDSVGTTNSSQTYQIDLTGVGRIEAVTEQYHGKCGNCNGSAGYTGASLSVAGVGSSAVGADGIIVLTNLEEYQLGMTAVTLNTNAGVVNLCPSCGGCVTKIMTIRSIKTYSYAPRITKQPGSLSADTDTAAVFTTEGSRITGYSWEQKVNGVFVPLTDAVAADGMGYAGTGTRELKVENIRYRGNQTIVRCVLTADNGGKLTSNEAVLTVTDHTAPTAVITKDPCVWTNRPVCVSAKAEDIDTGLAAAPYSWDGGITYTDHSSHVFSKNGTYAVAVKDASGNLFRETVIITELDQAVPTLSVSANLTTETKGSVTLLLTASDAESGLPDKPYYYFGDWHQGAAFEVDKNGLYEVRARDKAGNEAEVRYEVKNIKAKETSGGGNSGGSSDNGSGGSSNGTGKDPATLPSAVPSISTLPSLETAPTEKKKKKSTVKKEKAEDKEEVRVKMEKKEKPKEEVTIGAKKAEKEPEITAAVEETAPEDERNGIWLTVLAGFLGLLLFMLLLFFLFFGIWVEEPEMDEDEWRLYTVRLLYRSKKCWHVNIGKGLEECGTLRLRFGALLIALFEGWEFMIHTKGKEEKTLKTEIFQKLVVDVRRTRRN